ncbi:MAG TPA: zinc ribbon domain-containing protein [Blastocatellia bacterium]
MFCPRCSYQIVDNQNYCRNCGLKLDVIIDAARDNPRKQFDFEVLKRDLRDLGSSLRAGWEEAHNSIKNTRRLKHNAPRQEWSREINQALWSHEVNEILKHHIDRALKKAKSAHTRKHSFQQATLSIMGGGAIMAVWHYLLEHAVNSELLQALQTIILNQTGTYIDIDGITHPIRMLWMLGLIPVARGVAHLINGIFFAPKPEKEPQPDFAPPPAQQPLQPSYVSAAASPATSDLESEPPPHTSVTEDQTLRFETK